MNPTVSVIIPTHNRSVMLKRAIDSVLAQTFPDIEVIVVSDGSTDDTDKLVKSYVDPRIRFMKHDQSQGASAARNSGIKISQGKFIAFLDDDDEWTLNKLEIQVPVIEKSASEVGLVYAWMEYREDRKKKYVLAPELRGNIFVEMLDKQAIGGCPTIMIKREVLDVVQGFDENLPRGNDGDFIRRISKYYHVDYIPEVLAKIYVDGADRISVDSRKNLNNVVFALEKRLQDFEEDFTRYPEQKASVMANISINAFKTGQFYKGMAYLWRVIQSEASWYQKIHFLFRVGKSIVK